jgi:hypothetical protein
MMIGIGTPSSQSRIPRPMVISSSCLLRRFDETLLTGYFLRGLTYVGRNGLRRKPVTASSGPAANVL